MDKLTTLLYNTFARKKDERDKAKFDKMCAEQPGKSISRCYYYIELKKYTLPLVLIINSLIVHVIGWLILCSATLDTGPIIVIGPILIEMSYILLFSVVWAVVREITSRGWGQ